MGEYVCQSQPYLKDAQASLREAAVRFMGEPQPPGSLFCQPRPSPLHCTGSKGQPCGCQSPACLQEGPPRRLACWEPCSVPPLSGTVLPRGQPCCGGGGCAAALAGLGALLLLGACWGVGGLTGALCLGLAAQHLRKRSSEKLWDVCNGE